MRKVEGYLSEDGTFFTNAGSAELHEARQELQEAARTNGIDPDKLCEILGFLRPAVRRFIDAQDADIAAKATYVGEGSGSNPSRLDREDTPKSQESSDALQQLPPRSG